MDIENEGNYQNFQSEYTTRKFSDDITIKSTLDFKKYKQKDIFKLFKTRRQHKKSSETVTSFAKNSRKNTENTANSDMNKDIKLIRNRQSAKKSRHKKKIYVEALEYKLLQTQQELENYKK